MTSNTAQNDVYTRRINTVISHVRQNLDGDLSLDTLSRVGHFSKFHSVLVGEPFVDGSGFAHPGLIPIGITVLSAPENDLSEIRRKGLEARCDVVDFPREGQQTTNYQAFREATAIVNSQAMNYLAIALVRGKKEVSKIVGHLALLR